MPENSYTNSTIEPRVSSLETEVRSLERSIESLAHTTKESNEKLSSQISKLADTMALSRATPWGTLISSAGLLLAIVGSIGALAISPLKYEDVRVAPIVENNTLLASLTAQSLQLHQQYTEDSDQELVKRIEKLESFKDSTGTSRFSHSDYKELVLPRLQSLEEKVSLHQSDGHPQSVLAIMNKLEEKLESQIQNIAEDLDDFSTLK